VGRPPHSKPVPAPYQLTLAGQLALLVPNRTADSIGPEDISRGLTGVFARTFEQCPSRDSETPSASSLIAKS
jgi:hypothetical protein